MNVNAIFNIHIIYFILAGICSSMLICSLKDNTFNLRPSLYTTLLALILMIRAITILLTTSVQNGFVLSGSDQAFDHALTKCIILNGHLEEYSSIPRLVEYSYYPAIHFVGAIHSIVTGNDICIVSILPLLEPLILLPVLRLTFKLRVTAIILLLFILTNGYFSFFHVQYIREVFSFLLLGSLLLTLMRMTLKVSTITLPDCILISVIIPPIAFSHFYAKYVFLMLLYFFVIFSRTSSLRNLTKRRIYEILILMTITFMVYDSYLAIAYVLSMKFESYLGEILNVYLRLVKADFSESLIEITKTVGEMLPEHERLGIFMNQLVPLILLGIYIFHASISKERSLREKGFLLVLLLLLLTYYVLLTLKVSQDLYVVNIGLRASQYVLLLYFVAIIRGVEDVQVHGITKGDNARRTNKLLMPISMLIIPLLLSIATYPSLLPLSLKGLSPSYYIPYMFAKDINLFFPSRVMNLGVVVKDVGVPESELFRGFVYGLLPERTNLIISRVLEPLNARTLIDVDCDIIFLTNELEAQGGMRIFDAGLFSLYVPFKG